jgi:hypothetical protein
MSDTSAQAPAKQSAASGIEQDQSFSLLFDVSRELTSLLERDDRITLLLRLRYTTRACPN